MKKSKRYQTCAGLVDRDKVYSIQEAVELLKKMPSAQFDETVELSFDLGVDVRQSDQVVRGTVSLPHGTGKKVRVLALCKGEVVQKAKDAGADFVGSDEYVEKIQQGWVDFDAVVATPEMMKDLGKLGKILGPRGLMPSPKAGTVTQNIVEAVEAVKAGRIEFKMDKQGCIHVGVGKKSFTQQQLEENAMTFIDAINSLRPASVKGTYIKSIVISTTMSPGLKVRFS